MNIIKKSLEKVAFIIDILLIWLVFPSAIILFLYRRIGSHRLKLNSKLLKRMGTFPIINHYNEPLFDDSQLKISLSEKRELPGINFKMEEQLELLKSLIYKEDFIAFVESEANRTTPDSFQIDNGSYESGDSDFLFQFIRHTKPKKVVEIGSGWSTKVARKALEINKEMGCFESRHICIEPYMQPWLEQFKGIELIREKIEECDFDFVEELGPGDLLFIDSSHIIRPQGDIVMEYLNIIPKLKKGVYVHVHDIFTPYDYPDEVIRENVLFWNEQYILEATLGNQSRYKVIASLNLLKNEFFDELKEVCPYIETTRQPGSFYFQVI